MLFRSVTKFYLTLNTSPLPMTPPVLPPHYKLAFLGPLLFSSSAHQYPSRSSFRPLCASMMFFMLIGSSLSFPHPNPSAAAPHHRRNLRLSTARSSMRSKPSLHTEHGEEGPSFSSTWLVMMRPRTPPGNLFSPLPTHLSSSVSTAKNMVFFIY